MSSVTPCGPESEIIMIPGLGPAVISGTPDRGLVTSVRGRSAFDGRPVEFQGQFSFPPDGDPETVPGGFSAGARFGAPPLGDDEADEIREIVSEAAAEWWATPEAREMMGRNAKYAEARRAAEAAAEKTRLESERAELFDALNSGRPASVGSAERRILRIGEITRRLREIDAAVRAPAASATDGDTARSR